MSVVPGTMTAQQLLAMPRDGYRYELVQGDLRRKSPDGFNHGRLTMNISTPLDLYVRSNHLGVVCAAETGFLLGRDPDTVRAADVAFIAYDRLDATGGTDRYSPGAPELAVEVLSPNDLYTEVDAKVTDWLNAGTRMVVLVNPRKRTVTVYRSLTEIVVLQESDTLDGNDVIPGWSLPVASIFVW